MDNFLSLIDDFFSDVLLSTDTKHKLVELLNIWSRRKARSEYSVPCNAILIVNDKKDATTMLISFLRVCRYSKLFGNKTISIVQKDEKIPYSVLQGPSYGVVGIDAFDPEKTDMEAFKRWSEETHSLFKVLCMTKKEAEQLEAYDREGLYWKIYTEHIEIAAPDCEDIYCTFMKYLEEKSLAYTETFESGIHKYIQEIYPKRATKKGMEFVLDLYRRTENEAGRKNNITEKYDESCIPDWDKKTVIIDNYPLEYQEAEVGDIQRVLILNLSVLHRLIPNTYYYKDNNKGEAFVTGCYQLEPVVKMLLQRMKNSEKHLDEILMFSTDEALTINPDKVFVNEDTSEKYVCSAQGYFIHAIEDYIAKEEELKSLYDGKPIYYHTINISENEPEIAVRSAINHLRNIKKTNDEKPDKKPKKLDISVDTHGGFRDFNTILLALCSLLENEGIDVKAKNIWTVNYDPNSRKQYISNVAPSFDIFSFVSGMNEFLNYGRSENLKKYFFNASGNDKKLINAIDEVSDAIQLCDMNRFETGIQGLETSIDLPVENSFLETFKEKIRETYAALFKEHSVIDEVRWCLKKDFIQQALTLVEDRIPEEFVRSGIRYYCDNQMSNDDLVDILKRFRNCCDTLLYKQKYQQENPNHFFIKYYKKQAEGNPSMDIEYQSVIDENQVKRLMKSYTYLSNQRNKTNHASKEKNRITKEQLKKQILDFLNDFGEMSKTAKGILEKEKREIVSFVYNAETKQIQLPPALESEPPTKLEAITEIQAANETSESSKEAESARSEDMLQTLKKAVTVNELADVNNEQLKLICGMVDYVFKKQKLDKLDWKLICTQMKECFGEQVPDKNSLNMGSSKPKSPLKLVTMATSVFERVDNPEDMGNPFLTKKA